MPSIADPLARKAAAQPNAPALADENAAMTYRALDNAAWRVAANLAALGLGKGSRVALTCTSGRDIAALLYGAIRAGVLTCAVNPAWPKPFLEEALARVGVDAEVAEAGVGPVLGKPLVPIEALLAEGPAHAAPEHPPPWPEEALATAVFTSGSTGPPKAAAHSIGNHMASARASNANLPLGPGDCWLLSLPVHHVAGLGVLFRCLVAGARVGVPPPGADVIDAAAMLGATHMSLVAAQLQRALRRPEGRTVLQQCRGVLLGGGPAPARLVEEAAAHGIALCRTYGMTETTTQITTTAPSADPAELAANGRPLWPGTVRIGLDGVIEVCGPALFQGYLRPGGLDRPALPGGWFRTGDRGRLDGAGRLEVLGRADAVFVSGGESVQPETVEQCLVHAEGVEDAIVAPAPHPEFGLVPVAFVRMAAGQPLDAEALRAHARAQLPRYAVPKAVYEWPEHIGRQRLKAPRARLAEEAARRYRAQ